MTLELRSRKEKSKYKGAKQRRAGVEVRGGGRSQRNTCIILFSLFKPWEARGCKMLNFTG